MSGDLNRKPPPRRGIHAYWPRSATWPAEPPSTASQKTTSSTRSSRPSKKPTSSSVTMPNPRPQLDYQLRRRLYRQLRRLVTQAEEWERIGYATADEWAELRQQLHDIIAVLQEHRP